MTKASPSLTKTCAVCGLQKPISAFLQMSEKNGATYGSVCASCRHEQKDKAVIKKDEEDPSRIGLGLTIDAKARFEMKEKEMSLHEQIEEEYHKEREKAEEEETKELSKTGQLQEEKKKHQIEKQTKESFLTRRVVAPTDRKAETQRAVESHQQGERVALAAHGTEKTTQLEQAVKTEEREKNVEFGEVIVDVSKVKFKENPFLKLFLDRERGIAMNRIFGQKPTSAPTQSQSQKATPAAEKSNANQPERETPSQEAERKWGPRSR